MCQTLRNRENLRAEIVQTLQAQGKQFTYASQARLDRLGMQEVRDLADLLMFDKYSAFLLYANELELTVVCIP